MGRDQMLYIDDIVESIDHIQEYMRGVEKGDFERDEKLQDAVLRRIEIIGEAVKKISEEFKEKYSDVRWRDAMGMRDVLAHDYFNVELDRIWKTVQEDLPKLKEKISKIRD
ncbi:MAG: DUF86 domain-containing protein [Parcubacteria group bacterium]